MSRNTNKKNLSATGLKLSGKKLTAIEQEKLAPFKKMTAQQQWTVLGEALANAKDVHEFLGLEQISISALIDYSKLVILQALQVPNFMLANQQYLLLLKVAPNHKETKACNAILKAARREADYSREYHLIESFPTVVYPQSTEEPSFENEIISSLYKYDLYELPKEIVNKIIALPRESVLDDLGKVLKDGLVRHEHYKAKEITIEERSFMIHALFLVAGMKATIHLQLVLDILRQGEDFLEFWFDDVFHEVFEPAMFWLGQDNLEELSNFAKEPNLHFFARSMASQTASEVAQQFPQRMEEVSAWYEDIFEFIYKNIDNKALVSKRYTSFTISDAADTGLRELLPYFYRCEELGLICESVGGSVCDIEISLDKPNQFKRRFPASTWDFFSLEYGNKDVEDPVFSAPEKVVKAIAVQKTSNYTKPKPELNFIPVRTDKKTGRNEPCVCGSGKKYKKCCM